ncbi:MAG: NAD(P)/FAD-dependent oxidoreductase [Armatimonadota bacterium]|nr:NAD(P)/FAD-dependent oxidoreductase [Armatimonadota bacterium]
MVSGVFGGKIWDVLIIGAGPAGLSAAVNAKARNLKGIAFDFREPASKPKIYPEVTNYLGLPKVTGAELACHFMRHFSNTGFLYKKQRALNVTQDGNNNFMVTTDSEVHRSRTVIITTGVAQSRVLPGEEQYLGKGVSYCVTCDGALFRGKDVVVVGYIPEGEEEANSLAGFARRVTYVATYENVQMLDKSVEVIHANPVAIIGDARARAIKTQIGEIHADGIFIIREAVPVTTLLSGLEVTDGFIKVDRQMATSIPGVFAAGDCTGGPFQIAKAVGEGQVAALSAARYVYKLKEKEMSENEAIDSRAR